MILQLVNIINYEIGEKDYIFENIEIVTSIMIVKNCESYRINQIIQFYNSKYICKLCNTFDINDIVNAII